MDNHIYMVYDDTNVVSSRDADETHAQLLSMGYKVIHSEAGYNTSRIEYARVVAVSYTHLRAHET